MLLFQRWSDLQHSNQNQWLFKSKMSAVSPSGRRASPETKLSSKNATVMVQQDAENLTFDDLECIV